jgi:hypothetical protein
MEKTPLVARIRDRTLVGYCFRRQMSEKECFEHLRALYPVDFPVRSTISRYYKQLQEGTLSFTDRHTGGRTFDEGLSLRVSCLVKENPFLSLREIAKAIGSNKDTVSRILHQVLLLSVHYCKWIPHLLSKEQKQERVVQCRKMLTLLQGDEKANFSHVFTGDESWFFHDYPLTSYWAASGTPPLEIPTRTISTSKAMLVVFWGVFHTPVLRFLPRGESMTAEKFKQYALLPLSELNNSFPVGEKLMIHFDNARPHKAKSIQTLIQEEDLINIPQPAYSPDIAPSDFFLFGYIKEKLKGTKCETTEELLERIKKILSGITPEMRISVFKEWMERLRRVVDTDGGYI